MVEVVSPLEIMKAIQVMEEEESKQVKKDARVITLASFIKKEIKWIFG